MYLGVPLSVGLSLQLRCVSVCLLLCLSVPLPGCVPLPLYTHLYVCAVVSLCAPISERLSVSLVSLFTQSVCISLY